MSVSSFLVKEKKLLPLSATSRRFFICARSHEREMTACAFRSSRLEVALISLLMTLSRYFSTGNSLMATILSDSTTKRSVPRKVWVSLRSQWKLTPMVTSLSENEASALCGWKVSWLYWLPFQSTPPSENSTSCSPSHHFALGKIRFVEREMNLLRTHDAHRYVGLLTFII